jgi:hypothetical protein
VVDWALFVLVSVAVLTGLACLLPSSWNYRFLFIAHGAVGLALAWPLALKFRRVMPRVTHAALWTWKTVVSVLASVTVLAALGTGVLWSITQQPTAYPSGMHLHILFGMLLIPLYLLHTLLRFRPVRARDLAGRRTALRLVGVWLAGGAGWLMQDGLNERLHTPGARRRFTGSRETGGRANAFPLTNWMLDHPEPVDMQAWRLHVGGAVEQPLTLDLASLTALTALTPADHLQAVLDCTGGWYSEQEWQGVRVGRLLDQAGVEAGASGVSFVSVTGYRWSLPLDEAREALLATHVGGQPLEHGHGAPLRLVAPGRRGFQWVKWVTTVEVLTHPDYGQWAVIFTSGLQ